MGLEVAPPVFLQSCLRVHLGGPTSHPAALTALPPGQFGFRLLYIFGVPLDTVQRKSSVVKRYVTPPLYLTGHHLKGTWDFRGWGDSAFRVFSNWWMPWEDTLSTDQEVAISFPIFIL